MMQWEIVYGIQFLMLFTLLTLSLLTLHIIAKKDWESMQWCSTCQDWVNVKTRTEYPEDPKIDYVRHYTCHLCGELVATEFRGDLMGTIEDLGEATYLALGGLEVDQEK